MLKLAAKLALLLLLVLGVDLLLPGHKVYAMAGCPNPSTFAQAESLKLGVNDGYHAGNMAGLLVYATDADTGNNIDVAFHLHSGLTPNSPNSSFNSKIYMDYIDIAGNSHVSNRTANLLTYTNSAIVTNHRLNPASDATDGVIQCHGWDIFGPGNAWASQNTPPDSGNFNVLDCGPTDNPSQFWLSNLGNPYNDGANGDNGYWQIIVNWPSAEGRSGGSINIARYIEGSSMGINHNTFNVTNGLNSTVQLIWHPVHRPPPPDSSGTCQDLKVREVAGNTRTRTWVTATGVSVGKMAYTNNAGNVTWYPGPTGNDHYDPRQNNISAWVGPGGASGDTNLAVSKEWWFQPNANSITVTYATQTWNGSSWNGPTYYLKSDGTWTTTATSIPCFTANCNNPLTIDGDGQSNEVLAGGTIYISGSYTNTGLLPIWSPGLVGSDGVDHGIGYDVINPGETQPFSINMRAPPDVENYSLTLTPEYFGSDPIGASCSATVPIYQQFSASVSAQSSISPTAEHPATVSWSATINQQWVNPPPGMNSHGINNAVNASFYQKLASGGTSTPCSPSSFSSPGPYVVPSPGAGDTIWSHSCSIPPGSYQAGDEYCSAISAQFSGGFVGPDGNVLDGTGPATDTSCPRVVNEPYFKVYGGDISAGGAFDKCTTDGGTLAGYADISDPAGATRGSTTQLSALALLKITGVASAKTAADINGSPTKLTFANSGVQVDSTGNESPVLGGQFGGCRQLTNETAPPAATNYANPTFTIYPWTNGAYKHTGNISVNDFFGTLWPGKNVSLFVDGDVYISNNISYGDSWQAGTAPSFIVHATGNIYISPNVTHLAGVYIAQDDSSGNKGKIYTCADTTNHFSPMQADQLYAGCKNQLVVTGAFAAKQVNLQRTFGSLRDEEPNPGTSGGSQLGLIWSHAGQVGTSCDISDKTQHCAPGNRCTQINEPSEPDSHTWTDNYLCISSTSAVQLSWTYQADSYFSGGASGCVPYSQPTNRFKCQLQISTTSDGGHGGAVTVYCTQWNPADKDGWKDNYLCTNTDAGLNFRTSNDSSQYCTLINEDADPDGNWVTGNYLCEPRASTKTDPTPKGPPYAACSNKGTQNDTVSCAGELFEYGPTLYLSNPAVNPPGGGSLQFQSITSLPPVL